MTLREYLFHNEVTQLAFAAELGVSKATVNAWARGRQYPSPRNLQRIYELTGGRVRAADFFPNQEISHD